MNTPPRLPPVMWDDITRAAASALAAVAPALPPPASVVAAVAAAMAHALTDIGCAVLGCDATDAGPQPADIPTGEPGRDAMSRLRARAAGLDRRGIEERQRSDADEILSARVVTALRQAARGPTELQVVEAVILRAAGHG